MSVSNITVRTEEIRRIYGVSESQISAHLMGLVSYVGAGGYREFMDRVEGVAADVVRRSATKGEGGTRRRDGGR